MNNLTPREIISNVHEIGSLPQTLAAVLKVLNDPAVGADEIADVISKDVSLTSRVLKMVNSAHYSRRHKVAKVSEAVIVMGLNSIKILTLSSSVFGMMPDKQLLEKYDIKRLWRHLIETAVNARRIAREINYPEPEEAFVAGILHDIGIIILILHFKDEYINIIENIRNSKSGLPKAEKAAFGFTHGDVGAEMINAWKLPPKLAFVAQCHHTIDTPEIIPEDSKLNDIVSLADRLTLGPFDNYYPDIEENIQFLSAAREKLNLSAEATNLIRKESIHQAIKLAEYLDLDVGEIIDIITQANEQLAELYFSLEKLYLKKTGSQVTSPVARPESAAQPV
jgi:putative nucleotidyltransferase with HDIG domain